MFPFCVGSFLILFDMSILPLYNIHTSLLIGMLIWGLAGIFYGWGLFIVTGHCKPLLWWANFIVTSFLPTVVLVAFLYCSTFIPNNSLAMVFLIILFLNSLESISYRMVKVNKELNEYDILVKIK